MHAQTLRPRTVVNYGVAIDRHIVPAIGHVPLEQLTVGDVQGMVTGLTASGYKASFVGNIVKLLRSALKEAVAWELLPRNPAALVKLPRIPHASTATMTTAQARAFLAVARQDEWHPLWLLALTTGMRQGELLALRWADIDLDAGTLTVAHTLRLVPGTRGLDWELGEPKTARSRRALPLSRAALDALRPLRAAPAAFVFARPDGRPLVVHYVRDRMHGLLAAAGLPDMPFHGLRHAAAALLLDQNAGDLRVVQSMLGHASIAMTVNLYGGIATEAMERAARRMDESLEEAK